MNNNLASKWLVAAGLTAALTVSSVGFARGNKAHNGFAHSNTTPAETNDSNGEFVPALFVGDNVISLTEAQAAATQQFLRHIQVGGPSLSALLYAFGSVLSAAVIDGNYEPWDEFVKKVEAGDWDFENPNPDTGSPEYSENQSWMNWKGEKTAQTNPAADQILYPFKEEELLEAQVVECDPDYIKKAQEQDLQVHFPNRQLASDSDMERVERDPNLKAVLCRSSGPDGNFDFTIRVYDMRKPEDKEEYNALKVRHISFRNSDGFEEYQP